MLKSYMGYRTMVEKRTSGVAPSKIIFYRGECLRKTGNA